jgi:hypothetical protein
MFVVTLWFAFYYSKPADCDLSEYCEIIAVFSVSGVNRVDFNLEIFLTNYNEQNNQLAI